MTTVTDNVARVRERVDSALRRAGRAAGEVTIVAVTKTFGPEMVRAAIEAGIADIGENRVQELLEKQRALDPSPCRWHLVGPLQRNKAGKVVGRVDLFHAIDGVRIAETVDRLARERALRARVLLEVNMSGEASKHGVTVAEAPAAAEALSRLDGLEWLGLMTMGPLSGGADETRACFRSLARLGAQLRGVTGRPLPVLSMGMSDDFEVAIEEGATMIRVGRGITGERV
ncbi:MAG TPA: YggS family pyridoxal phosphate-dependent enzyme [Candidatus Krumholzibacteria bacterium]|nr:YggS family pyridoxal phosphate-dependent enzyme [Candidatus Krumholzibacteria bacterium]